MWKGKHHRYSLARLTDRPITTKGEATTEAERLRLLIKDGKFRLPGEVDTPTRETLTVRKLFDLFEERVVKARGEDAVERYGYAIAPICRTLVPTLAGTAVALGDWKIADVTTDTVEQFRDIRKSSGLVAANRSLNTLQSALSWAASRKRKLIDESPFRDGNTSAVERFEEQARARRLQGDEGERLLAACGDHLRGIVECALETAMRKSEIMRLQWEQIAFEPKAQISLPAWKTKTRKDRTIPMSSRLRAILDMRRYDPAGNAHEAKAYVFGSPTGQPIVDFKRAWNTAVLKAHGHQATYVKGANLSPASRAELRRIDLHFHDLRREAGSRWLDGGVPLHQVQAWLGHSNVSQTSTYLAVRDDGGDAAMARFEALRHQAERKAEKARRVKNLQSVCKPQMEFGRHGRARTADLLHVKQK